MPNEPLPDDIRNIWQDQPVENTPMPLEEIRRKARRFENRIKSRNLREYAGAAIGIAAYTFYFFKFDSPVIRGGCVLGVSGGLSLVSPRYRPAPASSTPLARPT